MTTRSVRGSYPGSWKAAPLAGLALALLLAGPALAEHEGEGPGSESPTEFERTPPRLSLADGEISFWRPGAEDWAPAPVNLALAPGDHFWAGDDSNLEIQVGAHAFVRAGEHTELALMTQEPDYLQFRVGSGTASLDLRRLAAGHTLELATPHGAFSIERTGYYRVEVEDDTTKLTSRRGGLATLTPARGPALEVAPSEQVIVTAGPGAPQIESYAAPELDDWDTWNYRRTDRQLEALSARYVNDDVYGLSDLDQHGSWRRVATYGSVWIPRAVPVGWAPYAFGRWVYDPFYGWTWVDDAAWGWAPFHYGRWIRVDGYWAWAPGPVVVRSTYAPALVAFYGSPLSLRIAFGSPSVAWVALGWGEPCVPWWGHARWRGRPQWSGWGGPRVVNKVVIRNETVIHAKQIRVYENAGAPGAFTAVGRKQFGRRHVREARVDARPDRFEPVRGELPVAATPASFAADDGVEVRRPPGRVLERRVVATRAAKPEGARRPPGRELAGGGSPPEPLLVPVPARPARQDEAVPRPPFGVRAGEERTAPNAPPRFEAARRGARKEREEARALRGEDSPPPVPALRAAQPEPAPPEARAPGPRRAAAPEREVPGPGHAPGPAKGRSVERASEPAARAAAAPSPPGELPGEPANRVYRGWQERPAGGEASPARSERSGSAARARGASSSRDEARSPGGARRKAERAEAEAEAEDAGEERR